MATISSLPLEILGFILDNVDSVKCLLSCARVNHLWNILALQRLYRGSLVNTEFHTPDIRSLNSLFTIAKEHFAQNMGFVKHLLPAPKMPTFSKGEDRRVCLETCLATSHGQFLQQVRGLASLIIPFEIVKQDPSVTRDLLLSQTIQFLAVDDSYCATLIDSFKKPPIGKFSNLKALTIYRLSGTINDICTLIESCDLHFFYLEDSLEGWPLDIAKLMQCLERQKNLQTLAMDICSVPIAVLMDEQYEMMLARLKSLQLTFLHTEEQLPKFENMRILRLGVMQPYKIAGNALRDPGVLLDIAHGCPLLQRLEIITDDSPASKLAESVFVGICHALPHLEILYLDFRIHMSGVTLEGIAHHCPKLIVFDVMKACLHLSLPLLEKLKPFSQLKYLRVDKIFFENPRRLWNQNKLPSIEAEWRRKFPKLRLRPMYLEDINSQVTDSETDDPNEECDRTDLRYDKLEHDLLETLWELLEYEKDEAEDTEDATDATNATEAKDAKDAMVTRLENLWQANLEMEILGWPIVPLEAFYRGK